MQLKIIKANIILEEPTSLADLQDIILHNHHSTNHRGIDAVFATISRNFYWPNLKKEVTKVINRCTVCNIAKYDRRPLNLPFKSTEVPTGIRETYQIDVWQLDTKNYFLSCIDVYSKFAQVYPIVSRTWIDMKGAILRAFNDMGKPKTIKADNDPGLKSKNLEEWQ